MLLNKRALKKRKGGIRQKVRILFFCLFVAFLLGGCYYLFTLLLHQNRYISPLSQVKGLAILSDTERTVKEAERLLQEKQIVFQRLSVADGAIIIEMDNGKTVMVSQKKDIAEQISSLQFILSRLTMEGREFQKLDLRFDKPTVVLEK